MISRACMTENDSAIIVAVIEESKKDESKECLN